MQSTSWETLGWMKHKLGSVCQEKYQQPQICRWHHPYVRKWRRTKEPLDESEREEWKSWLKTHSMGWVSVENINCCIPCCQNQRQLPTKTLIIISSQSWLSCRLTSKIPRNFAIIPVSLWSPKDSTLKIDNDPESLCFCFLYCKNSLWYQSESKNFSTPPPSPPFYLPWHPQQGSGTKEERKRGNRE